MTRDSSRNPDSPAAARRALIATVIIVRILGLLDELLDGQIAVLTDGNVPNQMRISLTLSRLNLNVFIEKSIP